MKHDYDDATVGGYLAGELPPTQHDAFETHLLTCDRCWTEVQTGQRGRALAALAREPVPAGLAARLAAVTAGPPPRRWAPARTTMVAAALVAAAVLTATLTGRTATRFTELSTVDAAVVGYYDGQLPGAAIPSRPAPDLSELRLLETGAGSGNLAGQPVTGYAYRDDTGRRLLIYISDQPFTMTAQVEQPIGPNGAAITHHRDIAVFCSRRPHTVLVIGADETLVRQAAATLDLI